MSSWTKWKCSVCTYENWSAAIKCTLCRSPRPTVYIEEEIRRMKVSPNDYHEDPNETRIPYTSSDPEQSTKCPSCTYINKHTSFKCEQCFHVLRDVPESDSLSSKAASAPTDPPNLPMSSGMDKWCCPQCTYENWPKSKLCVMCYNPPATTSLNDTPGIVEDLPRRDMNPTSTSSMSLGLPGTQRSKPSLRESLWLGACRAVLENEVSPVERYLLSGGRMERRLTKQDCRYLNAVLQQTSSFREIHCNTVNMDSVLEESSGCGAADASSSEETTTTGNSCKHFRVGWTLVDLAIRFGRADLINLYIALSGLQNTTGTSQTTGCSSRNALRTSLTCSDPGQTKPHQNTSRQHQTAPAAQQLISRTPILANRSVVTRSKWMPCQASPQIARELRSSLAAAMKHQQGHFPCAFLTEWGTFALPYSVAKLPPPVRYLLLSELCDTQAQSELEDDAKAINWWFVPGQKQASRLFALWNRTAGDCLLDSVLQACWGVFDRENFLRRTLAECLRVCEASFYSRWRDYEAIQAACHYILDETQCKRDWDSVLTAAGRPGGALEQVHIFALCHILRRPIIVYGVKYIKNYLDEPIGIANFQGIYVPLLWDRSFCSRNPIVLGYTRGHFTALVPMEPVPMGTCAATTASDHAANPPSFTNVQAVSPRTLSASSSRKHSPTLPDDPCAGSVGILHSDPSLLASSTEALASSGTSTYSSFIYLPLVDRQGVLLPIHFTTEKEANLSHTLLRDWLDVVSTRRGLPLARLRLQTRHPLVDRMLDEWLSSYKSLARLSVPHHSAPLTRTSRESGKSNSSTASSSLSSSSVSLSGGSECCDRIVPLEPEEQHSQST